MKPTTTKQKPTATKTELAAKYGVCYTTFINWLKKIDELKLNPKQRILTPKELKIIYDNLGEP